MTPMSDVPVVLKFGGSSVSTAARWASIGRIASARLSAGERPILVCSAVRGVTDALDALSREADAGARAQRLRDIVDRHTTLADALRLDGRVVLAAELAELESISSRGPLDPAAKARLLAIGERMSTRLGAAWLNACGLATAWIDARAILLAEPAPDGGSPVNHYLAATCAAGPDPTIRAHLGGERVVVTQGFTARDAAGDTVLLGRGGSDTSAAYIASRVGARRLEIWSDVPGLFTAHPGRYPFARLIRRMSYAEAEALAALGARALHPRSLRPLRTFGIPLHLGWTERPEVDGTVIGEQTDGDGIKSVTSRANLHLISMRRDPRWQPVGFMAQVAECFHRLGLSMDLISSSPGDIRVTVDPTAFPSIGADMQALLGALSAICEPHVRSDVASVSLVGRRVLSDVSRTLGDLLSNTPDVLMATHAPDDSSMTLVVEADRARALERALHIGILQSMAHRQASGPTWRTLSREPAGEGELDAAV